MTFAELAAIVSPFVAALTASGYIHQQFRKLGEEIAELRVRVSHLEAEVQRLREHR